jgi:hypothetical protein
MSKAEIIAELAHLSPEDLADIKARLDRLAPEKTATQTRGPATPAARIHTPRLADPSKAADFKKQVMELPAHAAT